MSEINFEKLLEDCAESKASIAMPDIKETLEHVIAGLYQKNPDIKNIKHVMGKDIVTNMLGGILFAFLASLYVLCVVKDEDKIEEYLEKIEETPDKYIN